MAVDQAEAGDIVVISGIADISIGETICDPADPQPLIGVANHGESSVDMDLKVWCLTEHYWDVKYYLEEHIKVAFDENGIQIPFPQMDVHIHRE